MQSFQSTVAQGPKNYVFVDEHNRHKRLKVMRACEGCRRRKIKCDAATTNSWPCAACKRLKLTCVPPVGGVDGELNLLDTDLDHFGNQSTSAPSHVYPAEQYHYMHNYSSHPDINQGFESYDVQGPETLYTPHSYPYSSTSHDTLQLSAPPHSGYPQQRYSSFDSADDHIGPQSVGSPQSTDSVTAEDLAESLGELRITDNGVAPYIRQQNSSQKEAPAPIIEDEDDLPAFSTAAGSQVRIPPALMPSDAEASQAFQDFFNHVHPYVPVLCRSQFVRQWQMDRDSISPLLLSAVLACAGQVSGDPGGGSQWLALANRHEESFADTPRLSTIQALLLLLKAREKTPKRGYYYRSWISVRKIVGLAKDLDLHEHLDAHKAGGQCDATPEECLSKTRIWQLAMILELMVGGPQGRSDYSVDIDTVDVSPETPKSGIDEYEKAVSRQFAYWVRNVRNIRGLTETYHKLKHKNKDWATDPRFVAYNEDFRRWPADIPEDLRIPSAPKGMRPKMPSHFLANMHCHYQLGIVMLYKPQLTASKDFANDESWKKIMSTCYNSAKQVCLYQEATLEQFDILGLASMQRGLSFPIYAILSCVMVHLIAITSPDPIYNQDAKGYFTRHMRVLERCIADWPMPEVEAQINGLRAAFSVDLRRPFDLKPTFPYGTPSEHSKSPEGPRSSEPQYQFHPVTNQNFYQANMQHGPYYATPPTSARSGPSPHDHHFHEYQTDSAPHQYHQILPTSNPGTVVTPAEPWNPKPIIDQFNTAFAIPQSALAPPPPSTYSSSPAVPLPQSNFRPHMQGQAYVASPTSAGGFNAQHPYTPSPTSQQMPHPQPFIPGHSQTTPQPQLTSPHYPQHAVNSYFDPSMNQQAVPQIPHAQSFDTANNSFGTSTDLAAPNRPVYVTPKEWQASVASVFDPSGLKRKWEFGA